MKDRRWFFRRAVGEVAFLVDELAGRPHLRLNDLAGLPDATLAGIVPILMDGVRIELGDGRVQATLPGGTQALPLFDPTPEATLVFNRFGHATLGEIAADLTRDLDWTESASFAHVKTFFLRMVTLGVCVPRDPVVQESIPPQGLP